MSWRIGTSGWSFDDPSSVVFRKGVRSGERLAAYARVFDTVEINTTFYRVPTAAMVEKWRATAPEDFRFAVKLWRGVTHEKGLIDCSAEIEAFLTAAEGLGDKRGPLLVQLPPSLKLDVELLGAFLSNVRAAESGVGWDVAVEFRHWTWLRPEVWALLDRFGAAAVLSDLPVCRVEEPNASALVYVRLHGSRPPYKGAYSVGALDELADRVGGWNESGRRVFVFFNNTMDGSAPADAIGLRDRLMARGEAK